MAFYSDLLTARDIRFLQTSFKPKYVNREDNLFPAYDFYTNFLKRKLEHALLSVQMAEKIIKKEDSLSLRQKTIQKDYAKAALFMDLGRSIEVTPMNKMPLFKNHGLESAFILQQEKTSKSLNVYIPILLHEFHDAVGILANPNKLKTILEPLTMSNGYVLQNREEAIKNAQFWIENFYKADSLAQQTALEGIKILKDSDKLSFLLEIKNLLPIKNLRADFSFSSDAKQALLSFRTVNPSFIKTIPDMSLYYLSSFGKFHYRSSLLLALAEKLHEKIAQHFLELTIRKKGHLSPSFSQEMFETCDIYIKKLQQSRFNQLQNFYAAHVR